MVITLSLLLCACGEVKSGVYYNGRELSDDEIESLMHRETETEKTAEYTLIAFAGEMLSPTDISVFWTKSGSVFHKDALCRHLLNAKQVYYGTAEEAASEGKMRACSACEKE